MDPAAAVQVGGVLRIGVDGVVAVLEGLVELDAQHRPRPATAVERGVAPDPVRVSGKPLVQLGEGLRGLL
jgi:hypothetical protein